MEILLIDIFKWIISSDSSGVLTVSTGVIALIVYKHQVKLREKEAAIVLLNEIRNAEKSLDNIKNGGDINNAIVSILPTSSWDKNYQIFARHLDRDQFHLLSIFFNNCNAAQQELTRLQSFLTEIAMKEKAIVIQHKLISLAYEYKDSDVIINDKIDVASKYAQTRDKLLSIIHKEDYWFLPNKPKNDFYKYLNNISKIVGTSAFDVLKKIARE